MKRIKTPLLMTIAAIFFAFWLAACDDDDNKNERHDSIEGVWKISHIEIDATPIANANMTEAEIEAIYNNYTFFSNGSQVTFQSDSINFIAAFGELEFPMKLPYTLENKMLTIKAELTPDMTLQIKGEIEFNNNDSFDFDITQQSYMSILQFISQMGTDEKLTKALTQTTSVEADYTLNRVKN